MCTLNKLALEIVAPGGDPATLRHELAIFLSEAGETVSFPGIRGLEPTTVAAIVNASGIAVAAVINGLFAVRRGKPYGRLVVRDGNHEVELPLAADRSCGIQEATEILAQLRKMDQPRITLEVES